MSDIEEVTAGLMETFRGLRNGTIEAKDAMEINNTAGKVISAYKTRIAYHALRQEAPDIPGLETSRAHNARIARHEHGTDAPDAQDAA